MNSVVNEIDGAIEYEQNISRRVSFEDLKEYCESCGYGIFARFNPYLQSRLEQKREDPDKEGLLPFNPNDATLKELLEIFYELRLGIRLPLKIGKQSIKTFESYLQREKAYDVGCPELLELVNIPPHHLSPRKYADRSILFPLVDCRAEIGIRNEHSVDNTLVYIVGVSRAQTPTTLIYGREEINGMLTTSPMSIDARTVETFRRVYTAKELANNTSYKKNYRGSFRVIEPTR